MAIKTDSTVDDPEMLGDGTQYIPEYRPPDYDVIGVDGGLFGGGLDTPTGNLADLLRNDNQSIPTSGYRPGVGIFLTKEEFDKLEEERKANSLGGNIFLSNPNWGGLTNPISAVPSGPVAPALTGATPGVSKGTGTGDETGGPVTTINTDGTPQRIVFDDLVRSELEKEIAAMQAEGVFSSDPQYATRLEVAANRGAARYEDLTKPGQTYEERTAGAAPPQGGIPLILPIPGLSPATAAILTAAGLIFSGGKIARLNPQNPAGSVAGAVQGIGQTGQNVIDVITGDNTLEKIWSGGTAPAGGAGGGAAAPAGQQTSGLGSLILTGAGAQAGGSKAGTMGPVGPNQQQPGGSLAVTPGALGGQAGGTAAPGSTSNVGQGSTKPSGDMPNTGGPYIVGGISPDDQKLIDENKAWLEGLMNQSAANRATGGGDISVNPNTPIIFSTGGLTPGQKLDLETSQQKIDVEEAERKIATNPAVISGGGNTGGGTTNEGNIKVNWPGTVGTGIGSTATGTTSTGTGTAVTPIIINAPTGGYNLPATGTPAQRSLYTEAGTTLASLGAQMGQFQIGVDAQGKPIMGGYAPGTNAPTLSQAIAQGYGGLAQGMTQQDITNLLASIRAQTGTQVTPDTKGGYQSALTESANAQTAAANTALRSGNIADAEALAARAQALRQAANPALFGQQGALPQYTQQAQEQVMRDVAALRSAEAGNLTPEQIRNAQQAAREAYGARGQVMSQGAAAQEVLNRQAAIQQQQQLARQNLAQSMGQLGQGVAYQTANIFDPMAAVLGGQYGMQSQNVGMNQALYNQAMGLTSGAGGYGFAQQMINPFSGYAQDVYGTNVNAANAAQIAAANRQAALEAAKMGQTGTYAQALGNLIASGGLGQIQSGITGGVQGLLSLLGGKWPTS